jgi:hypothetical protein
MEVMRVEGVRFQRHIFVIFISIYVNLYIKMTKPKNSGGKTKHMKKGGKDDSSTPKVLKSLNDIPVPADYEEEGGGVWVGVVTERSGGPIYKARQVTGESVIDELRVIHRFDGKLSDKSGRRVKCPNVSVGTLVLCAERTYESKKDKKSDIIWVYNQSDEVPYIKQIGVIHPNYEMFVDENLRAKILAEGKDDSAGDTGFDFGDKIDMEKL